MVKEKNNAWAHQEFITLLSEWAQSAKNMEYFLSLVALMGQSYKH